MATPYKMPWNVQRNMRSFAHPRYFTETPGGLWQCSLCVGRPAETFSRALEHETSRRHTMELRIRDNPLSPSKNSPFRMRTVKQDDMPPGWDQLDLEDIGPRSSPTPASCELENTYLHEREQSDVWPDAIFGQESSSFVLNTVHGPALEDDDEEQIYDNWGGLLVSGMPTNPDYDENGVELPEDPSDVGTLESIMPSSSRDEGAGVNTPNIHGVPLSTENVLEALDRGPSILGLPKDEDWWPYPNKETLLMDVLGAFPRAMQSEAGMDASRWFATKLGAPEPPTVKQTKGYREKIFNVCGGESATHEGKQGNWYTMNGLQDILKREWANPLVRPHVQVYPEATDNCAEETAQAEHWRLEADPTLAAPMARSHSGRDYFVMEPALVNIDGLGELAPVIILRWFQRCGKLWAQTHRLRLSQNHSAFVVDGTAPCLDVPLDNFLLSVVELGLTDVQRQYGLPAPDRIDGILRRSLDTDGFVVDPWNEPAVHRYRTCARGRRVQSVPIWFYCDDTSGNTSKKWNKHNSLLFTLAGLPRKYAQMLYNVQFLATSNQAPPLEMMEHLVEVLQDGFKEGFEVWDCSLQEDVLLIPWVLAFQGDNPMSSEFASHIGMKGTCFCRICHVRGADTRNRDGGLAGAADRLSEFISSGELRSGAQTIEQLTAQLARALGGAPSGVDDMASQTGVKDKYLQHWINQLQAKATSIREEWKTHDPKTRVPQNQAVEEALRELRATMPENLFNPVLFIPGFDANRNSPVELLHVLLLGVVKYWWRDAVSRLDAAHKEVLKTRLSSLNITGLSPDISRLRGHTLVYYAGSLVGRDFRVLLQVAPIVLQGLIPEVHYRAWLTLCRLAPLLYQPKIERLAEYLSEVEDAITDFLAATALWTTQWFNKPKFHLFIHLPWHIRRFGPAILYATETFESFNFVIRLRSIHSPRTAPSLDIAHSFRHLATVRHLVSGGYVDRDLDGVPLAEPRQAGKGVLTLLQDTEFCRMMCMDGLMEHQSDAGKCTVATGVSRCRFDSTRTWTFPDLAHPAFQADDVVSRCRSVILTNKDQGTLDGFVLYRSPAGNVSLARIEEILANPANQHVIGILVARYAIGDAVLPYNFPSCVPEPYDAVRFLTLENILCTVNVVHNCVRQNCPVTRTRVVIQERYQSNRKDDEITHIGDLHDMLLNVAQLHNAALVQPFRPMQRSEIRLSREEMIRQAVENREHLNAEARQKKEDAARRKEDAVLRKAATSRKQSGSRAKKAAAVEDDRNAESSKRGNRDDGSGTSRKRRKDSEG